MHPAILGILTKSGGFKILTKRWKELFIVALVALVAYQNLSDTRWALWADTIPFLRLEVATARYELVLLEQANENLSNTIIEQNAEIERWANLSTQLEKTTKELQTEILKLDIQSNKRIRVVEREIISQECDGAMEFLYDSIPELQYNDTLNVNEDNK